MIPYEEQMRGMAAMQNVGMLGGQMNAKLANANKPSPVIEQQMGIMDERLDVLAKLTAELEARLMRVMRHDNPKEAKGLSSATATGVPLGDALAMQGEKLAGVQTVLRSILDRLEL